MKIEPMLAMSATKMGVDTKRLLDSGDWIWERKWDGIRAWLSPEGLVYTRTGRDITDLFPEVSRCATNKYWVDGEIVGDTFEDVLLRESQSGLKKHLMEQHPVEFIAFDLPGFSEPWALRRNQLVDLVYQSDHLKHTSISATHADAETLRTLGHAEGYVLKRKASPYTKGRRSPDWLKVKFTERITCIAYGYTRGSGSRERFGAIQLALLDEDGAAIPVGRVGTGFTDRQIMVLKERLDRGEPFPIEIETLNFTALGRLRQPTFVGVRGDVDLADCTFDQH